MRNVKDSGISAIEEYVVEADENGVAMPTTEALRARKVRFFETIREIPQDFFYIEDGQPYCLLEEAFIPASVEKMGAGVFAFCVNLRTVICESPSTIHFDSLEAMFLKCQSLTDISFLSDWNTAEVVNMMTVFAVCTQLHDLTPISEWDTSNVTSMAGLFAGCSMLFDVSPLASWNTKRVKNTLSIFEGCYRLRQDTIPANFSRLVNKF